MLHLSHEVSSCVTGSLPIDKGQPAQHACCGGVISDRILTPYAAKERPACTPPKPLALPPKVPTTTAQRAPSAKLPPQAAPAGGHRMPDQAAAHPQSRAAGPTQPVNAANERRKHDEKSKVHPACWCNEVNSQKRSHHLRDPDLLNHT